MENNGNVRFLQVLRALASITKTELSPYMVDRYDAELQSFGYEKVADALEGMFNDLNSSSRFPSINQIKAALGEVQLSDEELARDAIQRLRTAIGRFGYNNEFEAMEYVGSVGRHLVKMFGGWVEFCGSNDTYKILDFSLVQAREYAKVAIKKHRAEELEASPDFVIGPAKERMTKLISDLTTKIVKN